MKTLNFSKIIVLVFLAYAFIGCSSNDGGGTVFIPGFNATWPVVGDENRQIDLQPDEANKNVEKGVFNGAEILNTDDGTVNNPLSGSFNGLDIEFTITRANNLKVQYKGKMIPVSETNHQIVRIELNSSEGNIALEF